MKLLLQYPADPNIPNNDNAYPIHLAAKKNHPVAIAYLMENGAGEPIDQYGDTPLLVAAKSWSV
ncbi:MAG: ankyrin repeat domain-containing protein [Candidatus Midichloria sp.]|nr:ankyrin repeat domain-containing protein [Candidatus Midichloria sp.]